MQPASLLLKRYIWILNEIYHSNGITREQLNEKWRRSSLNTYKEEEIPERTFHRYKKAIKELFDIEIICDRNNEKRYRIDNRNELEEKGLQQWLMNSFAINSMINESRELRDRILFEEIPSGQKFLIIITEAMKNNRIIRLVHQKFGEKEYEVDLEPYCLKVSRQRWYVFGRRISDGKMRVYSLDRVQAVRVFETTFEMPKDFDADKYFNDSIGIIIGAEEAQYVEIKVDEGQQNYMRSLPIHHSQQEIEKNEDYSIFSFYVRPTFDFVQELLKYGENLKVLKPEWLSDHIKGIAQSIVENYNKSEKN